MNVEQYAFKVIKIGGICQSHLLCAKLPAASWWRYDYNWIWHVDVFRQHIYQTYECWLQIEHSMFELYLKHDISYAQRWRYDYN